MEKNCQKCNKPIPILSKTNVICYNCLIKPVKNEQTVCTN